MDTGRLVSTIVTLLEDDVELKIQSTLANLQQALASLQSQPAEPTYQIQVREALAKLSLSVEQFSYESDPIFREYATKLRASPYFSIKLLDSINNLITDNPMTPAVAQQGVSKLQAERTAYVEHLKAIVAGLADIGVDSDIIDVGQAQIGFRIPRVLFSNELKGWISELNEIRRIIAPFSELATGNSEKIEIGEVSSTDPIIFVILKAATVAMVGRAVAWAITQWKQVEEIRKIRAETAAISAKTNGSLDEIAEKFEAAITKTIEDAVAAQSILLVQPRPEPGRSNELVSAISMALTSLVARIERGMTVELKFIPHDDDDVELNADEATAMADLKEIVPLLKFPPPSAAPIIALPRQAPEPQME